MIVGQFINSIVNKIYCLRLCFIRLPVTCNHPFVSGKLVSQSRTEFKHSKLYNIKI